MNNTLDFEIESIKIKSQNQFWYVNFEELDLSKTPFASGATSDIFDCNWRGAQIAVKKLKVKEILSEKDLINEVKIWHTVRHPNIVQFLGMSIHEKNIFILIQKINGSNLRTYIENNRISQKNKKNFSSQLISIFNFLHNCNPPIIYRDLKAENLLIEGNKLYLTDFGLSKFYPENSVFKMTGETGTLRYMAPEVFNHKKYNLKADIYSLGMILYYLYKKEKPFSGYSRSNLVSYFESNFDMTVNLKNKRIKSIIENCIKKDISERYDINQLFWDFDNLPKNNYCCNFI